MATPQSSAPAPLSLFRRSLKFMSKYRDGFTEHEFVRLRAIALEMGALIPAPPSAELLQTGPEGLKG